MQTNTQLLTAKAWKLVSYGYDSNNNGLIETNEEIIQSCQADNTYLFDPSGSGLVAENDNICSGSNPFNSFQWKFRNGETVLDFIYGSSKIISLTKDQLILSDTSTPAAKLILRYIH